MDRYRRMRQARRVKAGTGRQRRRNQVRKSAIVSGLTRYDMVRSDLKRSAEKRVCRRVRVQNATVTIEKQRRQGKHVEGFDDTSRVGPCHDGRKDLFRQTIPTDRRPVVVTVDGLMIRCEESGHPYIRRKTREQVVASWWS